MKMPGTQDYSVYFGGLSGEVYNLMGARCCSTPDVRAILIAVAEAYDRELDGERADAIRASGVVVRPQEQASTVRDPSAGPEHQRGILRTLSRGSSGRDGAGGSRADR
jgi:hypothetical protein